MNVLVLGSEGFIGSAAVRLFSSYKVHGADLHDAPKHRYPYTKISRLSPEFDELLGKGPSFDACINAAGSGNVGYSMAHPVTDFEANSLDTIRLLDALRRYQPRCKYVHISSAAVYGNPVGLPVCENDRTSPISAYGWHKLISEQICHEYHLLYNIPVAIVRPFSVYGAGLKKQLFWDLMQKCLGAVDDHIDLWGTGNESRDFIYVDDLIRAINVILHRSAFSGDIFNIASGTETTIRTAASLFVSRFNPTISVTFNGHERKGDPQNWRADITGIRRLGFAPEVDLTEGVDKLILWMKNLN